MEYAIICIFMESGKTFTFRDIEITCNNENTLCFNYGAMSDDCLKDATFQKANIVGYSTTNYEEE